MKLSFITILISSTIFISGSSGIHIINNSVNVNITNYPLGNVTITIDGKMDDWSDIENVPVTLKPARVVNEANDSYNVDFYSTHHLNCTYNILNAEIN